MMKKRLITLLASLSLLISLLPGPALGTDSCMEGCSLDAGHTGACVLHEARYQIQDAGDWHYGTLSEACANVYPGGTVTLLRDIDPAAPVTVSQKLTLTSVDPDSPCTVSYTTNARHDPFLLTLTGSADVTLRHIILDGGRTQGRVTHTELVGIQGGTLTMEDGAVIQNNDNIDTAKGGGGLRVVSGQAVMQSGSLIRTCRGVAGGGAAIASETATLILNGGVIEACQSFVGGGVFIQKNGKSGGGKLYLYDGAALRQNEARKTLDDMSFNYSSPAKGTGGAICVEGGYVYMLGGAEGAMLSDNYAESVGGGLYLNEGFAQLANGRITQNYADSYGGGVGLMPMNQTTKFLIGNSPYISGNTSGDKYFYDMYMDGAEDDAPAYGTVPILIAAPLKEHTAIGVSRWLRPDETHRYRIVAKPNGGYTITESDLSKFYSNDPAYIVLLHEGNIVLTNADVVFDNQGHGAVPPGQRIDTDRKVTEPDPLTEAGYTFGGWFRNAACTLSWDFASDTIVEDREDPLTLYAKWTPISYAITYTMDGGENSPENPAGYTIESDSVTLNDPIKAGHTFLGWTWAGEDTPQRDVTIPQGSIGDKTFTAHWRADTYPVTFNVQGHGAAPADQQTAHGALVTRPGDPSANGWIFGGWYQEPQCETPWDFNTHTVTSPVTLYAKWTQSTPAPEPEPEPKPDPEPNPKPDPEPDPKPDPEPDPKPDPDPTPPTPGGLDHETHFAYIVGYPDGSVRPEANITRSEAVSIFFRLMTDAFRTEHWSNTNPFSDTAAGTWYYNAVSTSFRAGLIEGFPDGTFGGDRNITRAEFTAIAARFLSDETAPDSGFPDLRGHWAKNEVDRAVAAGWIKGFPDGSFRPDAFISRAEVMTLVNRMLNRVPTSDAMHKDMLRWPDNPPAAWYYTAVQEATNAHSYDWDKATGAETWTALTENRDWTALERCR